MLTGSTLGPIRCHLEDALHQNFLGGDLTDARGGHDLINHLFIKALNGSVIEFVKTSLAHICPGDVLHALVVAVESGAEGGLALNQSLAQIFAAFNFGITQA